MSDILKRLQNLHDWKTALKHMRGRHDQRTHNRYPPGYVAQSYVPVARRVGNTAPPVTSDRRSSRFATRNRRFSAETAVLGNTMDTSTVPLSIGLSGAELTATMQKKKARPTDLMIAKHLMERGRLIEQTDIDEAEGRKPNTSLNERTGYWAQGVGPNGSGFFTNMYFTPMERKLTYNELSNKSVQWQRAYIAALQKYADATKSPEDMRAAYKKAIMYADYVHHATRTGSPWDIARNLVGMGNLQSLLGPMDTQREIMSSSDLYAPVMFRMRRLLSVPMQLWQKYKPGTSIDDTPYYNDLFLQTRDGLQTNLVRNGELMADGMARGKTSILGSIGTLFPEMNTHLRDIYQAARKGLETNNVPSNLLVGITSGDPLGPPQFAPKSSYEFSSRPAQPAGTSPRQIDDSDAFVEDTRTDLVIPADNAKLADAIDPNGLHVDAADSEARAEVNPLNFEDHMAKIRDIAQSTGVPTDVVAAVMAYWQNGAQTIGNFPAPMLVRLQAAAAELFGLQLGDDGKPLNDYQQYLLDEADALARGQRQWGSSSNDMYQRTMPQNEHWFIDPFERDYTALSLEDTMFPFRGAEATTLPAGVQKIFNKKPGEVTPEERAYAMEEVAKWREANRQLGVSSMDAIPGTPYSSSQQARKAVLKAIYDRTQQLLADAGVKRATLYRNVTFTKAQLDALQESVRQSTGDKSFTLYGPDGKFNPSALTGIDIDLPRNALESWSYDFGVANSFGVNADGSGKSGLDEIVAEIVLASDVDASRMVSTPATGFGQYTEGEVVITGNKADKVKVVASHSRVGLDPLSRLDVSKMTQEDIVRALLRRLNSPHSAYWYTDYKYLMSRLFASTRRDLIERRANIIKNAKEAGVFYTRGSTEGEEPGA